MKLVPIPPYRTPFAWVSSFLDQSGVNFYVGNVSNCSLATCPSGYTKLTFTNLYGQTINHCYKVITSQETYATQKAACEADGAKLASIHSQNEEDAIRGFATESWENFRFLGLTRATTSDAWAFEDGTPIDFKNWINSEGKGCLKSCTHFQLKVCRERASKNWPDICLLSSCNFLSEQAKLCRG